MGAFAQAVEIFAAQKVAVIPTRANAPAVPMVKNAGTIGLRAARKMEADPRFEGANAAVCTGERSRLTVVDIDSTDPEYVALAVETFGSTPLEIQTPSGGRHLYYRHAGEPRRIRPLGKRVPIDVLGAAGICVVPPSMRPETADKRAGAYSVTTGDLRNLASLPTMKAGSLPTPRARGATGVLADVLPGSRDDALFRLALRLARTASTESELATAVLRENAQMPVPLDTETALAKARQAWRYKGEGRLMVPGGDGSAVTTGTDFAKLADSHAALALLTYLRINHARSHQFVLVPDAVGRVLHLSHKTVRAARAVLIERGFLRLVARGGHDRRTPNLYAFA